MGATFRAYKMARQTEDNIPYSMVQRIRHKMMAYCERNYEHAEGWAERFGTIVFHNTDVDGYNELMEEVGAYASDLDSGEEQDILYGVYIFCNHSDCDGEWCYEDCQEIAMALKAILSEETPEGIPYIEDEHDRERIMQMQDVFESIGKDGKVEIV